MNNNPNKQQNLIGWTNYIKNIHHKEIDLGLTRIRKVADQLNISPLSCPIITITGTNGKSSCVATLENIYITSKYQTCSFSSPCLFEINEQIRINGKPVTDQQLCAAFATIDNKRNNIPLTMFEFLTLAALIIFKIKNPDVIIMETGMGGRQDAANIIDNDIAIITNVTIDHAKWLGDTIEKIAWEKAGIMSANKPIIYGIEKPPLAILKQAQNLNSPLYCQNKDFSYQSNQNHFTWKYNKHHLEHLPLPTLPIQNTSLCLMAIELLQEKLPIEKEAICKGIINANLPGRFQMATSPLLQIFDVAHNPAAATFLATNIKKMPKHNKTKAVFSVLADKDILGIIKPFATLIDEWYIAPVNNKRFTTIDQIKNALQKINAQNVYQFTDVKSAYIKSLTNSSEDDRVIIFGSFHTVLEAYQAYTNMNTL